MQNLTKWILPFLIIFALGCQAEQDGGQAANTAAPAPAEAPASAAETAQEAAPAQSPAVAANYVAGTHYEVLPQSVPTADPSRI
ncbi:MAG: hypothetical protein M0R02_12025, partial [Bacteroidales bacterium]|nr:hypothetical protein [Bacteroidales bacterium]